MSSSPPPILVAAVAILATRALVILSSYAAYLRWRARRTLKALLCAAGLGRAEGDAAAPDPADDEPEVEDVESVAAASSPPRMSGASVQVQGAPVPFGTGSRGPDQWT